MYITRNLPLAEALRRKSVLLLGPRRTGKSSMIRHQLQPDRVYNLLESDTFRKLSFEPELIRKSLTGRERLIVIDEIQKLPQLMDEVHLMIEEKGVKFLLTGSSARKLRNSYTNLMAGRATRMFMHPSNSSELGNLNLDQILSYGVIPGIHLSEDPQKELDDYVGLYLREEILAEARVRKIDNFSRFLEAAAHSNGQILNFEQIAHDAQVPARTIREYYQLLEDTLFGKQVHPLRSTSKRKSISKSKFFFFDLGVISSLQRRSTIPRGSVEYGAAFEHFIFLELDCYRDYLSSSSEINFWQDYQEGEVDFIINQEVAIEVKGTERIRRDDLKSMKKFMEKGRMKRHLVVTLGPERQKDEGIEILPYQEFLKELWSGQIF